MNSPLDRVVVPHTGGTVELPLGEHELAVAGFCTVVDDTLLSYAEHVDTSDYTTLPNTSSVVLTQHLENGARLHVVVGTKEASLGSAMHKREVFIAEYDPSGAFQRRHLYKFIPGALEVVRSDAFKPTTEENMMKDSAYWKKQDELLQSMSIADLADEATKMVAETTANAELDRQTGFNHLPVSAIEVESLIALIQGSQLKQP